MCRYTRSQQTKKSRRTFSRLATKLGESGACDERTVTTIKLNTNILDLTRHPINIRGRGNLSNHQVYECFVERKKKNTYLVIFSRTATAKCLEGGGIQKREKLYFISVRIDNNKWTRQEICTQLLLPQTVPPLNYNMQTFRHLFQSSKSNEIIIGPVLFLAPRRAIMLPDYQRYYANTNVIFKHELFSEIKFYITDTMWSRGT